MALLVDSSVWIDYFNGIITPQTDYLDKVLGQSPVVLGDLILVEVLQGFRSQPDFEAARDALLRFPILEMVGVEIALKGAENYRALRTLGYTVSKTIDCIIATFCIENKLELLHADRDFEPFEANLGLVAVMT